MQINYDYRALILDNNHQASVSLQRFLKEYNNIKPETMKIKRKKDLIKKMAQLEKNKKLPDFIFLSDNFNNISFEDMVKSILQNDGYSVIIGCFSFMKEEEIEHVKPSLYSTLTKPYNPLNVKETITNLLHI